MAKLADYLKVKEAGKFLGVAPNTIRNWDRNGTIPVHRHPISNYRLFRIEDLDQILRQVDRTSVIVANAM